METAMNYLPDFGRAKRVSRERASERRSREARFACPNRRTCSQASYTTEKFGNSGWMVNHGKWWSVA